MKTTRLAKRMTLLCITLLLATVLWGCGPAGPSHSEARNAVLDEVQTWASVGDSRYIGVEDAEIVEIAKMTKHPWAEEMKVWPMRLYLIKQGSKVKCGGWLFKNSFGEWKASIQYDVQW